MIYKLEKGMELDFIKKVKGEVKKRTVIVYDIPDDPTKKITVIDKQNGKLKKFTREALKSCKRHKADKKEKISALSIAIKILERENIPIHIDELIEKIFEDGYTIPRGGKTFKNTISTSLNNECSKFNARIKKVYHAVYAIKNCDVPYKKKLSVDIKGEYDKAFSD